jgi:Fe2+ transport system protein FeoA
MDELKPGAVARIVTINKTSDSLNDFNTSIIREGCYVEILSCLGNIIFKSNDKTFVMGKGLAENIRVIPLIKKELIKRNEYGKRV